MRRNTRSTAIAPYGPVLRAGAQQLDRDGVDLDGVVHGGLLKCEIVR
jgi:hypothetical protein